jgi:hypothetical protein
VATDEEELDYMIALMPSVINQVSHVLEILDTAHQTLIVGNFRGR